MPRRAAAARGLEPDPAVGAGHDEASTVLSAARRPRRRPRATLTLPADLRSGRLARPGQVTERGVVVARHAPSVPPEAPSDTPGSAALECSAVSATWVGSCKQPGRRAMLTLTENASTIVRDITTQPGLPQTAGLRITTPEGAVGLRDRRGRAGRGPGPGGRAVRRHPLPRRERRGHARGQDPRRRGRRPGPRRVRTRPPAVRAFPQATTSPWPPGRGRSCARDRGLAGSKGDHDPPDPADRPTARLTDSRRLPHGRGDAPRSRPRRGAGAQHLPLGRPLHARSHERRQVLRRPLRARTPRSTAAPSAWSSVLPRRPGRARPCSTWLGWREHALLAPTRCGWSTPTRPRRRPTSAPSACPASPRTSASPASPSCEGDTVFVSGAAGAVGSMAGQIARRLGAAKVVGLRRLAPRRSPG